MKTHDFSRVSGRTDGDSSANEPAFSDHNLTTHQERAQADRIEWRLSAGDELKVMNHRGRTILVAQCGAMTGVTYAEAALAARQSAEVPAMVQALRGMVWLVDNHGSAGDVIREVIEARAILSRIDGSEGGV